MKCRKSSENCLECPREINLLSYFFYLVLSLDPFSSADQPFVTKDVSGPIHICKCPIEIKESIQRRHGSKSRETFSLFQWTWDENVFFVALDILTHDKHFLIITLILAFEAVRNYIFGLTIIGRLRFFKYMKTTWIMVHEEHDRNHNLQILWEFNHINGFLLVSSDHGCL